MEFNPQGYSPDGTAIFGSDAQLLVKFFNHPTLAKYDSDNAGMPIYHDVEMISVINPGEKEEVKVLATDFHRRRFPRQYENFRKGIEEQGHGTPLDHLFPSEPSTIKTLNGMNVYSIQQLAAISDSAMTQLPMGRSLAERAKAYLSTASSGSEYHQMQKQIAEQAAMLAELQAKLASAETPEPARRGPGRPPKGTSE